MAVTSPLEPRLHGRVAVVSLPAEIDLASAEDVALALLAAVVSEASLIVADMSGTTFCDTAGALAIACAAEAAAGAGAELRVTGAGYVTRRVLRLLGHNALLAEAG